VLASWACRILAAEAFKTVVMQTSLAIGSIARNTTCKGLS
jgi:hypothetical protein